MQFILLFFSDSVLLLIHYCLFASVNCGNTDLVQRPHRNLGDIVGDELPGGALWVAGREALSVPQVT